MCLENLQDISAEKISAYNSGVKKQRTEEGTKEPEKNRPTSGEVSTERTKERRNLTRIVLFLDERVLF